MKKDYQKPKICIRGFDLQDTLLISGTGETVLSGRLEDGEVLITKSIYELSWE